MDLPEILLHIFRFLNVRDLKVVQYVDKMSYKISHDFYLNHTIEIKLMNFHKNNNLKHFTKTKKIKGQSLRQIFLPNGYLIVLTELHHEPDNFIVVNLIDLQGNIYSKEFKFNFNFPLVGGINLHQSECFRYMKMELSNYFGSFLVFDIEKLTCFQFYGLSSKNWCYDLTSSFTRSDTQLRRHFSQMGCHRHHIDYFHIKQELIIAKTTNKIHKHLCYSDTTFFILFQKNQCTGDVVVLKSFAIRNSTDEEFHLLFCPFRNDYVVLSFKNIINKNNIKIKIFKV